MTQNDVLPVAAHARGAQAEGAPARAARALGRAAVPAALIAPAAVAAALVPFRDVIANIDAALVLVLVVVAVATAGNRAAGALAALSAGVWFDFFLTRPYERLTINDRADVETTVLLLAVGVAVTELAIWGRRQQALAARQGGHLSRIQDAAESVAARTSSGSVIEQVREQLTRMLRLRSCVFDYGGGVVGGDRPRLRPDGQVVWRGHVWDVERDGLPVDQPIELLLNTGDRYLGSFLLTAPAGSHPSLAQRLVAVALAERAATALGADRTRTE